MKLIIAFLNNQILTSNKREVQKLRRWAVHFIFQDEVLYKWGTSTYLLRCIGGEKATYVLQDIHKGVYGNYFVEWSLAQKVLRQGYYWSTLKKDTQ